MNRVNAKINAIVAEQAFGMYASPVNCTGGSSRSARVAVLLYQGPGVYFRALLPDYFERIHSELGIAWRLADSWSLCSFIGYALTEATPDRSTLSRTRRLHAVETHKAIFHPDRPRLGAPAYGVD